ncbi:MULTISPECIES: hypothetical protein [unclassified Variovorax]|jgi:hypothetical protein|uniref:hypothetical protein n=1 Tax=unclassified Variovorax TaxID=663243 RepID=UPI0015A55C80|nr:MULTISPECIES: hypothetical protein [unclassified Variovorax]
MAIMVETSCGKKPKDAESAEGMTHGMPGLFHAGRKKSGNKAPRPSVMQEEGAH